MADTSNPLVPRSNSIADDIAAVIGFTATLRLCAWYGNPNANLYVPSRPIAGHEIEKLIGASAFKKLCQEWGNETLSIPMLQGYEEDCRNRLLRDLLLKGLSPREISRTVFIGERRVQQLRTHLEEAGMIPLVFSGKNAGGNAGGQTRGEKRPAK